MRVGSRRSFLSPGTDCGGGGCPACSVGSACTFGVDCVSLVCVGTPALCVAPTCQDGVANGSETDIDCGGTCGPCGTNAPCVTKTDCVSKVCTAGKCKKASCSDGVTNGLESGIDCGGGGACARCADGAICATGSDCASHVCSGALCKAATCSDGVKNGSEGGVDCGLFCGNTCPDGSTCSFKQDCASGVCGGPSGSGTCSAPRCDDSTLNGTETFYDCGGGTCMGCGPNDPCRVGSDCRGGDCDPVALLCRPSCTDGRTNNNETSIDCGGPCSPCRPDNDCKVPQDCTTSVCSPVVNHGMHCMPLASCTDGLKNGQETDLDCGGPFCLTCTSGKVCLIGKDCASTTCAATGRCT